MRDVASFICPVTVTVIRHVCGEGVSEEGGGGVSGDSKTRRQVDTSINGFESQWCNKDKLCFILSLFLIPPSLTSLLPPWTADAGGECVCYYFVDILVQAECAGAWLVMAGYVCNVWADAARAGTQEMRREEERGGSTAGTTA